MQLIIMLAAFAVSCVILAYLLGEAIALIWRPALAIIIGAAICWPIFAWFNSLAPSEVVAFIRWSRPFNLYVAFPILTFGAVGALGYIIWEDWIKPFVTRRG